MIYQRIRYFLTTCETGSIKKASEKLYISAPALTKQINILEEELGNKLFKRTPQGVTLTWFGEFAKNKFSHLDNEFQTILSLVQSRAKQEKPRVNIGIFSSLPQEGLVSPFVSYILSGFPEYQINLNMVDLEYGKLMMLNNQLDLLLTNTHEEDNWINLKKLSFGSYPAKVIVSLFHPWTIKDSISLEDLKTQTFIKMTMEGGHYTLPDQHAFYNEIPCRTIQEVSNFHTLFTLLMQGEGFAVFPEAFSFRENARIKCFDYPGRTLIYHTALIYNPNSALNGINTIAQSIKDEFELIEY